MSEQADPQDLGHESSKVTHNIISNSLDLKDWLEQIQPEDRQANSVQRLAPSVPPHTSPPWFTTLHRWIRRVLGQVRGRRFIEILSVEQFAHQTPELFWNGWFDSPQADTTIEGAMVPMWGWVIGKPSKVTTVRLVINQTPLDEIPVNVVRPGVHKAYPFLPPDPFGYYYQLCVDKLPDAGSLRLDAIFEDGKVEAIALIKFYRY